MFGPRCINHQLLVASEAALYGCMPDFDAKFELQGVVRQLFIPRSPLTTTTVWSHLSQYVYFYISTRAAQSRHSIPSRMAAGPVFNDRTLHSRAPDGAERPTSFLPAVC